MKHQEPANLQASLTPLKPAIRSSGEGDLEVLLRIKAPAIPGQSTPRTPLSLALVIDRSGSMAGERLEAAKACALDLVQRLHSADEVSLVTYDSTIDVLLPLMPASQARDQIRTALASFEDGGSTDLHGGWLRGAQQLAGRTSASRLCRVILLSDGQANHGETDVGRICEQVRLLAQTGISTTTVGLGEGFNEELMTAMAVAGQGNALYGERAEDLSEAFDSEISLLSNLAWRDVHLVSGSASSRWVLRNDYAKTPEGAWSLPGIAEDSEAWALFSIPMDSAERAQARSRQGMALHVTVTARDANGQEFEVKASLPALPVVEEAQWAAMDSDELVARRLSEVKAAELQQKARDAVERGDWKHAEKLLKEVEVLAADNPWLKSTVEQMKHLVAQRDRARFGKETVYASMKMLSRITEIDEKAAFMTAAESIKPAYLRKKAAQGKSSSR